MGKGKKRGKKKSEFDDFFETAPTEEQWLSGIPASAMDTDDAVATPSAAAAVASEATVDVMDTTEGPTKRNKSLSANKSHLKRGQKTTIQQKRKNKKFEQALARSDKLGTRVAKQTATKHRKASLKAIY